MMKFTTDANVNGTSLQGYFTTTYEKLVQTFGEPSYEGGDKTTCEWHLEFEDGTVATIYDWKEYTTPYGEYRWHIGGRDYSAVERVTECLNGVTV